jgi:hypothetical protein
MGMAEVVKLSANLSQVVIDALRSLADRRGITMTEALRQSISHEKFFQDALDQNEKILLRDKQGNYREVLL